MSAFAGAGNQERVLNEQSISSAGDLRYLRKALNGADVADMAAFKANLAIERKNYIINGAMMVSQQNGATAVTTSGAYPADQWQMSVSNAGTLTVAQVASVTPAGSPNRLRFTVTSADAAVAAGDLAVIQTRIEGYRAVDLLAGTANAKTVTLAFGVKAPEGTYGVTFWNNGSTRSRVEIFTISGGEANTDVRKTITVSLDTAGTWNTENLNGLGLSITLMAGATYQKTAASWSTGWCATTSAQSNFMGTNGNVFELFDVSLTEGSIAPAFQVPGYAEQLSLCSRYFQNIYGAADAIASGGSVTSATALIHRVPMRAIPTYTVLTPTFSVNASASVQPGNADGGTFQILSAAGGRFYWSGPVRCDARLS